MTSPAYPPSFPRRRESIDLRELFRTVSSTETERGYPEPPPFSGVPPNWKRTHASLRRHPGWSNGVLSSDTRPCVAPARRRSSTSWSNSFALRPRMDRSPPQSFVWRSVRPRPLRDPPRTISSMSRSVAARRVGATIISQRAALGFSSAPSPQGGRSRLCDFATTCSRTAVSRTWLRIAIHFRM